MGVGYIKSDRVIMDQTRQDRDRFRMFRAQMSPADQNTINLARFIHDAYLKYWKNRTIREAHIPSFYEFETDIDAFIAAYKALDTDCQAKLYFASENTNVYLYLPEVLECIKIWRREVAAKHNDSIYTLDLDIKTANFFIDANIQSIQDAWYVIADGSIKYIHGLGNRRIEALSHALRGDPK